MSFLWPAAGFLGLLALPVIALYLIRTRLERRPASTLLFWDQIQPRLYNHSLWRRLRRWLSLALQLLFLFLLILALSRPLAPWQSASPVSRVLIVDTSASLGATDVAPSRWEESLRAVRRQIDGMGPFDEATLIAAHQLPTVLCTWTRNKRTLARSLDTLSPMQGEGDIRGALSLARHLADARPGTSIVLISDGVWSEPPETLAGVAPHWIAGEKPVNAGLTLFAARRSNASAGAYQLVARVVASGPADLELEIRRNGALIDVQSLHLDAKTPWEKSWDGTAMAGVRFEARLGPKDENGRDDLATDNRAETRLDAVHPITVALHAPPQPFLDAALQSLPLVNVRRHWPPLSTIPPDPEGERVLHLFYRTVPPPGFEAGAMVFINPSGDGVWGKENGTIEAPLISDAMTDSAPLRFVGLDTLRLGSARDFAPPPGITIFAESFGKPMIFGRWPDGETNVPRWLALSFGLEESDLVFRTAFPILLGNLVQSLQPDDSAVSGSLPGETQTRLAAHRPPLLKEAAHPPPAGSGWWSGFPVWWWALGLAFAWLLAEWRLYTRRITE